MTEFTIGIAEKNIRICAIHEHAREFCKNYLTDVEPDFSVSIAPEDIAFERAKSEREDEVEGIPLREFEDDYLETLAIYRKIVEIMVDHGAFLFHGSAVAVDGEGYLFTAKSGTGKSTHTRRWRKYFGKRCITVNDDKPLLLVKDDVVLICGTPWDGKHRLSANVMVPMKGLIWLERGETNEITPISVSEALPMLLQQTYRPANPMTLMKTLQLLEKMSKIVGLYRLYCNMHLDSARIAYEGMQGKEN